MKFAHYLGLLFVAGTFAAIVAGCVADGGESVGPPNPNAPPPPTPTPAPKRLYVDHNGTFYEYALPLTPSSKPQRTLAEWPGLATPPQIAVDAFGLVALASPTAIRIFAPPIVSFARSHAKLTVPLSPAMTEIGPYGAVLVDIEYDPNRDLWLLNNLGGEVTELRAPVSKSSVAAVSVIFGAPGSSTSGYSTLIQARFDVNATLYVYAANSAGHERLFKTSFPYASPPSSFGVNLAQADFVDASQWPPSGLEQQSLILGQYYGLLHRPPPGQPPPPPSNVLSQFVPPLNLQQGYYPEAVVDRIVGALIADPDRAVFYSLDKADGSLDVSGMPLRSYAKPKLSLPCLGGSALCGLKPEHIFTAP
jgi:hypothetical protein